MIKHEDNNGIKQLARAAKARLKKGGYEDGGVVSYNEVVKKSVGMSDKDRDFYNRVAEILQDDGIINPILRLIDREYINTLDYSARQRYLLETAEKYNRIKKEIESGGGAIV